MSPELPVNPEDRDSMEPRIWARELAPNLPYLVRTVNRAERLDIAEVTDYFDGVAAAENPNVEERRRVAATYLGLVVSTAYNTARVWFSADMEELIQVGTIGLMNAIEGYGRQADRRALAPYAQTAIRREMRVSISEWNHTLSATKAQFERYTRMQVVEQVLANQVGDTPACAEIINGMNSLRSSKEAEHTVDELAAFRDLYASSNPIDIDTLELPAPDILPEEQRNEHIAAERHRKAVIIERAMTLVQSALADIVYMKFGLNDSDQYTHQEIATRMGIGVSSVPDYVNRGLRQLAEYIPLVSDDTVDYAEWRYLYPRHKSELVLLGLARQDIPNVRLYELRHRARRYINRLDISPLSKQVMAMLYGLDGQRGRSALTISRDLGINPNEVTKIEHTVLAYIDGLWRTASS